jgi:putative transport protein
MAHWFVTTLQQYPEIAIFLSLAAGYYFGSFTYKGLGLGAVTATLIAAVLIGQLDIQVAGPLKPTFFLMFLFAIGYGVGPQFVRGIAQDGVPQAVFAAVVCVFCLGAAYVGARWAGYDVGSAAGLYAGSQTISASMGLATDAGRRDQENTRRDAGGICGDIYLRHDRLGDRAGNDRSCVAPHRSRSRMQAL